VAREGLNPGIFVKCTPAWGGSARFPGAQTPIRAIVISLQKRRRPLSETEDLPPHGRRISAIIRSPVSHQVSFDRGELNAILRVYGRKVAEGEWRDYAIDSMEDRAVFSIFRRASEAPTYRVEKIPAQARRGGAYRIVATTGLILKRSHELAGALRILDKPNLRLVSA
jgi:Protein of unknown function (DUF2794)